MESGRFTEPDPSVLNKPRSTSNRNRVVEEHDELVRPRCKIDGYSERHEKVEAVLKPRPFSGN